MENLPGSPGWAPPLNGFTLWAFETVTRMMEAKAMTVIPFPKDYSKEWDAYFARIAKKAKIPGVGKAGVIQLFVELFKQVQPEPAKLTKEDIREAERRFWESVPHLRLLFKNVLIPL